MPTTLRQLNNILLDVRMILNQIERNPRAEITNMKKQMHSALVSLPEFAEQVEDIRSLPALYQFGKHVLDELKLEIIIKKEG